MDLWRRFGVFSPGRREHGARRVGIHHRDTEADDQIGPA
jgi:hypothetical protein